MAKKRFAQFNIGFVALSLLVACGTVPRSSASADFQAELSSSKTIDGSIVLVSLRLPVEIQQPVVQGHFENIDLPFFRNGEVYQSVLGVPYDHKPGLTQVQIRVGEGAQARTIAATLTIVRGNYESEVLKVQGSKVRPQNPKDLARIKIEQAEIGEVYSAVTLKKYWSGPFLLPVQAAFTSRFGTKRVYNGLQKSAHLGLDFKAPVGTPIMAAAPGKVVIAKDLFFTGNTVILDHGYGVLTLYAHMSKLNVKKGQEVKAGELLGLSGKTGRVTGPHLHWMAIVHKQKVNPFDLTQVMK